MKKKTVIPLVLLLAVAIGLLRSSIFSCQRPSSHARRSDADSETADSSGQLEADGTPMHDEPEPSQNSSGDGLEFAEAPRDTAVPSPSSEPLYDEADMPLSSDELYGDAVPQPQPSDSQEGEAVPQPQSSDTPDGEAVPQPQSSDTPDGEAVPQPSDSLHREAVAPLSALLPSEAVVYNYQELKSALEGNNGITAVYFGADITMQLGGIRINPNKQQVAVSGRNPLESDQTAPYTLTDYSSSAFTATIYIDVAGIDTLTIRDMSIVGKNFYGSFSIIDAATTTNTQLIFERVNYNGPQMVYHRRGAVYIADCTVRIHGGNGGSVTQEFSEAKHLVFRGNSSISTDSSAYSIFWHPYGGSFTLTDDSSLTVNSPNTSALYGVFFADLNTYKVDLKIGERAELDMTAAGPVAPEAYTSLSSFTVGEAGSFYLQTTKSAAAAVLRLAGDLTVEKEGRFSIDGFGGASQSLLRQGGGDITVMKDAVFQLTSQNAYAEVLQLAGSAFLCDDPASVLLYNAGRDVTASSNPSRVYVNAQQLNYWDELSAGGLDAPAKYRWVKADKSMFFIDGTLSTGAKGNFSTISSNYTPGDPPGTAPDPTSFNMETARVLAFGRLELNIIEPTVNSTAVSGVTHPGAAVRVTYTQQGVNYTLPDVTADPTGIFHVPLETALDEGTIVNVRCAWRYLTASGVTVVESGSGTLEFFVPDTMEFFISDISSTAQTIKRLQPSWEIIVSDNRSPGSGWSLYARLGGEMTADMPELPPLSESLIFVADTGTKLLLSADWDTLIASHGTSPGGDAFPVTWAEDEGILLAVKPGAAFSGTVYTTSIIWTLVNAP